MLLDELLERRLLVLTGKGGVGKSTLGLALALAARRRGKRVLLVEIDAPVDASRRLGGHPSGSGESEILPGLFATNLRPLEVMDEYVRHAVRVDLLVRRILEAPVYHRFFAAAPGLKELMVLGKVLILEEARDRWSRRPRYDLIVLDAPATGHGLSLLSVPVAAAQAAPVGPVGRNARKILELLRDPRRTALGLVAIPEEMAIVEVIELHGSLKAGRFPSRAVFLNACHERRFTEQQEATILRLSARGSRGRLEGRIGLEGALLAARRQIRRRRLTRVYEARLRRSLPLPLARLPFLYGDAMGLGALESLSERLEGA
ncbi:MAG TPA: ArsA-related P-loop ATPase [Vicinamibacteria bacterium]|jgi:anion-transporting  ArsA/GET3 family ATPase|nr:ArsA-related P-loop ATPase [Vicinamibacteria bacterium]